METEGLGRARAIHTYHGHFQVPASFGSQWQRMKATIEARAGGSGGRYFLGVVVST